MGKKTAMTPCLQGWLRHLQCAERQGITLSQYAQSAGLKVGSLYEAKRRLGRLGAVEPNRAAPGSQPRTGEFLPVQVLPVPKSISVAAAPGAVCRLRTAHGLVIECADWPPASWMAALISAGTP
jgi:hypothetical protein